MVPLIDARVALYFHSYLLMFYVMAAAAILGALVTKQTYFYSLSLLLTDKDKNHTGDLYFTTSTLE